jgi:hypothetical protein
MMTSIQVSYGRKQPGPQEYSSESLHITIVQDLGTDGVEDADLRHLIEHLHELLKQEVDQRLGVHPPRPQLQPPSFPPDRDRRVSVPSNGEGNGNGNGGYPRYGNGQRGPQPASQKQVNFLLGLAAQSGMSFDQLGVYLERLSGKRDPYALSSREAAQVIDALKNPGRSR